MRNVIASARLIRARQSREVEETRKVLEHQAQMISDMAGRVDESFVHAVDALQATEGHVVVIGVGKSGIIGRKIASTLASTGTPAIFVSAAEAHHGDLGMLTPRDIALLISNSGKTNEVMQLIPHLRRLGIPMIALVGHRSSPLARATDIALDVAVEREACPSNLAPTSSALAALAMGDALACSLMRRRNFGAREFAMLHPGGRLGSKLHNRVKDVMRATDLPMVTPDASVADSLLTITEGRLGMVLVMERERLVGVVTDGDLRRCMQHHGRLHGLQVSEIMTRRPMTIDEDTLQSDAYELMQAEKITALVVVDGQGNLAGVVQVFDVE
jgi:arabinose-5-phosphate isomerase